VSDAAEQAPADLPPLGLVVARAKGSHAIGRDNQLVFRIKEDLQHFKHTTLGHPILMGRKTYESIGKPLPGRTNVVLSRDPAYRAEGVTVCADLDAALAAVQGEAMPYVIGGGELYAQALPRVTQLVLTEVDRAVDDADTFFTYPEEDFRVVDSRAGDAADVTFVWLERVPVTLVGWAG
jgi:dihydrofolate reductase